MKIYLIDAIGPFFRGYSKRRINWSKIPFHDLDLEPTKRRNRFDQIARDLEIFSSSVKRIGYNSVSLDDVAHLSPHPWLEQHINETIAIYQEEFRKLFLILKEHDLKIFLTMDVLSFTPALKSHINGCKKRARQFLKEQLETFLTQFPEVSGVIMRIGESDGKDVKGDFKSELILKSPRDVNRLLHDILPTFSNHKRYLILRTWTVGAYKVGDLIWHRKTSARVLKNVDSSWFILSMKYGESDFFRYLPLNKHFYHINAQKMIELQARREYEGCGEYPSFIGWDYHAYAQDLERASNLVGMCVWCQTGGWVPFRRLAFLEPDGIWNEINSFVTIQLFKEKSTVEEALTTYCQTTGCCDPAKLTELLKLSDEVIKDLLYIKEVANLKLFFRRVRIPPLLTVYWNNIFINHSVRKVLLSLVTQPEQCVEKGYTALKKIEKMRKIAKEYNLPHKDITYMADTFSLLALAREYYFLPYSEEIRKRLKDEKKKYKKKYPKSKRPRYRIKTNFSPFFLRRTHLIWLMRFTLRNKRGYRVIDYLLTLHFLGVCYRFIIRIQPEIIPKFARKHAMGIETIFK